MHFTYAKANASDDLQQGDILSKTDHLREIIAEIHPYYIKDDYTCFMVLTQSCDLVQRNGIINSRYVTICPARPLDLTVKKEIRKFQDELLQKADAVSDKAKDRVTMFLERLLNNNNHEYFYLHDESSVGLRSSCAFLRLSIALHSKHYQKLRAARMMALTLPFQAKLGWLVGDIFSRVGTDDWVPHTKTAEEWKALLNKLADENVLFLPDQQIRSFAKKNKGIEINKSATELRELIRQEQAPKRKDQVIEAVISHLVDGAWIDNQKADSLRVQLKNSAQLSSLVK